MKRLTLQIFTLLLLACNKSTDDDLILMPQAPNYESSYTWYTNVDQTPTHDFDVFYILPTCVFDWSDSCCITYHNADVYNTDHRDAQLSSFELAGEIFGNGANFYAPYYRQITLDVWMSGESEVNRLFPAAMADIEDAFENFIETKNSGRPFILAGFSQGGKGVVELVKGLSAEELERMVAAYVIGYKVTEEDLQNTNFKGATTANDTGVTICYNSVETIEAINSMISDSELSINPVNWSTDQTPAILNDTITVTLNKDYSVLIVDGLDSEALYIPELESLFKIGNYHLQELLLYKDCLTENVAVRFAAF